MAPLPYDSWHCPDICPYLMIVGTVLIDGSPYLMIVGTVLIDVPTL